MKCPVCYHSLRRLKSRDIIIDACPHCKGIWFDDGELPEYVKSLSQSSKIQPRKDHLFESRQVTSLSQLKEQNRICPCCEFVMKKFNYAYDSNVFLDKCPNCNGLWADAGEVSQIASYLKDNPKVKAIAKDLIKKQKNLEACQDLTNFNRIPLYALYMPKIIIPLSDDTPRQKFPFLTITIIAMCTACFLAQTFLVGSPGNFVEKYGFVPSNFFDLGLLTSIFLHGGTIHLIGNMFFLWLFGDNIEDIFSRLGFLTFYLACGIFANVIHGVFNLDSQIPCIGASGAISGIMGAYLAFYPKARLKVLVICRIIHIPAYLYLVFWFLLQIFNLFLSNMIGCSGVAWYAHIGGFVFGLLFAVCFKHFIAPGANNVDAV